MRNDRPVNMETDLSPNKNQILIPSGRHYDAGAVAVVDQLPEEEVENRQRHPAPLILSKEHQVSQIASLGQAVKG
jgi:hypothetical protein